MNRRYFSRPIRRIFTQTVILVLFSIFCLTVQAYDVPETEPYHNIISRLTVQLLNSQHFTREQLNDEISEQLFNEYFDSLDPSRKYFLQEDIEDFSKYRHQLDDQLKNGNAEFGFKVYQRFVKRVQEHFNFARQRLKKPFDFEVDEEVLIDREDSSWLQSREEQRELWRKLLKNRVLTFKLMEMSKEEDKNSEEGAQATDEDNKNKPDEESSEQTEKDESNKKEKDSKKQVKEKSGDKKKAVEIDLAKSPRKRVLRAQKRHLELLKDNKAIDVLETYLSTLAGVYGPHSTYMAPSTEEDFNINMSLSLEGIGAVLTQEQGYVKVVRIVPGGPADKNGHLEAGDRILSVSQVDSEEPPVNTLNMPLRNVVQLIRGEKGTKVELTILKGDTGLSGVPKTITITRDEVKLKAQKAKDKIKQPQFTFGDTKKEGKTEYELLSPQQGDEKIMVIRLQSFYSDFKARNNGEDDASYNSSSKDVKKLLKKAEKDENIHGVVLDLRSNGGGSLQEAIKIAGYLLPGGPVLKVKKSSGKPEIYRDSSKKMVYSGPLAVMVNKLSASASEIVSGAIKDYKRGIVVGGSTHGKGTVQTVVELDRFMRNLPNFDEDSGSLKFTIAKFYRVNGKSTQCRGVKPHIDFPTFTEQMDLGESSLDHSLPFDKIKPMDINPAGNITPYLDRIKERSRQRLENSTTYEKLTEAVKRFEKLRNKKKVTLLLEERRKTQKEEKEWLEKVKQQTLQQDQRKDEEDKDEDDKKENDEKDSQSPEDISEQDLMLEETLRIVSDLYWLQHVE